MVAIIAAGRKHRDGSCRHLTKELLVKIRKFKRIDREINFDAEHCSSFLCSQQVDWHMRLVLRPTSDLAESTDMTCVPISQKNCKMRKIPNGFCVKCNCAKFHYMPENFNL